MKIILIAAIGAGRELGKHGDLIWRVPGDMSRVKELTMGHPVIMGRKTYESFPQKFRPLSGRTNIVLTTKEVSSDHDNLIYVSSIQGALREASESEGSEECYIFGGAEVYRAFLPYANALELTMIEARDKRADTYFPHWESKDFQETCRESHVDHDPIYHFVSYRKKQG